MLPPAAQRPDPDALLAQVQAQARLAARGRLRIYFGASAGVGKTCAMLAAGRKLQAQGQAVTVGIVETHGRAETLALLDGLPILPRRPVAHRGQALAEFDIDAALALRPPAAEGSAGLLILVDELAHANAPGSRHPKRWQDVEELLNAGIDVFTTVNVQHLESLNDVVGSITGVRVTETLPDTVFDAADEVVMIDLPADELLARLKEGKIYPGPQAERAARNFFRRGNLMALRELALRRTADRIEDDVQAYRIEQSIAQVWKIDAALLACIGPRDGGEHVIRSTARLAAQQNAEWHAIYVETPMLQRLPSAQRERILKTLKLGRDLGATTAILSGSDIAAEIVQYARGQNFSRIILARGHQTWPWRRPHARRIARLAPDLDLTELGRPPAATAAAPAAERSAPAERSPAGEDAVVAGRKRQLRHYAVATAASLLTAVLAAPLSPYLDLANIAMLFLLTVVLVAARLGRGPAITATVIGIAAFDFFFVSPRFSFAVSDVQYLVTFAVMLAVGLIISQLTSGLRYQARIASHRAARAQALYEYARALTGVLETGQVFEITRLFVARTFQARAVLLLPDAGGQLQLPATAERSVGTSRDAVLLHDIDIDIDIGIARWAFDRASPAGLGTDTLPSSPVFYLPLVAPMRTRGVLAIQPQSRRWILIPEQRQQLDTFAALAAIALERVHYIDVAQDALLRMESERLRNSLLTALSHDLRTPLTALVGLSESLATARPPLAPAQQEFADALHEEALRMSQLVANLLDMARIQSGEVKLNLQWQPIEEVVGSALRASRSFLGKHGLQTQLAADLPLIRIDAVLIERVLCNLMENATKYTPTGSQIVIDAALGAGVMDVTVRDNGPGLPAGREEALFDKFVRGERESATPGVGLGLSICRAIAEAHGGRIHAARAAEGGAAIVLSLPLGVPPAMPKLDEPVADG